MYIKKFEEIDNNINDEQEELINGTLEILKDSLNNWNEHISKNMENQVYCSFLYRHILSLEKLLKNK